MNKTGVKLNEPPLYNIDDIVQNKFKYGDQTPETQSPLLRSIDKHLTNDESMNPDLPYYTTIQNGDLGNQRRSMDIAETANLSTISHPLGSQSYLNVENVKSDTKPDSRELITRSQNSRKLSLDGTDDLRLSQRIVTNGLPDKDKSKPELKQVYLRLDN